MIPKRDMQEQSQFYADAMENHGTYRSRELQLFRSIGTNDILFINSSHLVSVDSDVLFEYLRVLPECAGGCR